MSAAIVWDALPILIRSVESRGEVDVRVVSTSFEMSSGLVTSMSSIANTMSCWSSYASRVTR